MSDRSAVEQELMDVSKFKSKNYPERQDELAALVRAIERVPDAAPLANGNARSEQTPDGQCNCGGVHRRQTRIHSDNL